MWPAAGTGQERDGGSVDRASVDAERGRAARSIAEMATIDPKTMERIAAGTRALEVIVRAGVAHEVHAYESAEPHGRARDRRPSYGIEAARALGVEPARVFKTLAATVDGRLVLAVLPVDRELDPKRLADALGGRRAVLAEPADAERATGYVIGGISPLGTRRSLPVVVDASATGHPTVFVSAGRRGLQVELGPADLVRLSAADVAPLTREAGRP
jgi:Cys-tRNA(Pro)/Cys-tRNA(Cys) deacylase